MKKINMKFITGISIISLGGFALYKYNKAKKVEKNTKEYILNEENENRIKLTKKRK